MANWNGDFLFNHNGEEQGATWNSDGYVSVINASESFSMSDDILERLARFIVEDIVQPNDEGNVITILNAGRDQITFDESVFAGIFFEAMEQIGISDELYELMVLAYLQDDLQLIDDVHFLATYFINENIGINEITDLEVLLELLQELELNDLETQLRAYMLDNEVAEVLDKEPKKAISDFLIGAIDTDSRAFDWLIPFGLKVDWDATEIDVMPEAELTTIEMPGIDGSIVEDTVYKDRIFKIVAFSEDGLDRHQREEIKAKIDKVLDVTKHQTKKLTYQATGTSFDVKYDGQAEIEHKSNYIKATIPFHAPPYGYDMFEQEVIGSGLIINDGDAPLAVTHIIEGAVTNPSFTFAQISYMYQGTIPENYKLVINHEMLTCYLEDASGNKTNALANLKGNFTTIPTESSTAIIVPQEISSKVKTVWRVKRLW